MNNMKLYDIQKESEKIKIKKSINDFEDLKAQVLLKLGIMVYDKIRKGEMIDEDFNILGDEIKNFDIEIYTKYMQLRSFENENKKNTCQCGYIAFKNEKFCPQCGNSLIENEKLYITCQNCKQETEKDSNFCACCGSKIKQNIMHHEDEVCYDNKEIKLENFIVEETEIIEDFGKEFLKQQEGLVIEEYDLGDDKSINEEIEEESIEIEGREFLKNHKEQIQE